MYTLIYLSHFSTHYLFFFKNPVTQGSKFISYGPPYKQTLYNNIFFLLNGSKGYMRGYSPQVAFKSTVVRPRSNIIR